MLKLLHGFLGHLAILFGLNQAVVALLDPEYHLGDRILQILAGRLGIKFCDLDLV